MGILPQSRIVQGLVLLLAAALTAIAWAGEAPRLLGPGPAAWQGDLTQIGAEDWSYDRARHLLQRAGFGGTPDEIARLAAMTPEQAVGALVDFAAAADDRLPAFDQSGAFDSSLEPFPKSRADAVRQARANGESMGVKVKPGGDRPLQPVVNRFFFWLSANRFEIQRAAQWWAERMVATDQPLKEKMALFWHGHFATGAEKVRDYRKMINQLALFHRHGIGNFRELLKGLARDPAMLVFLDSADNVKGRPNENFGREVLELFTIGIGNYTEAEVRETARAFTGWTNRGLDFVVVKELHDDGPKTMFGQSGNYDGEAALDLILAQPAAAEFIAGKIARFFVRDDPEPDLVAALGKVLRESDYALKPLLRTIFLSRDFYSPASYASHVKSPVEYVVGAHRQLGLRRIAGIPDFNAVTEALGQQLFNPPNVAGWKGGRSWVTPALLIERGNFARDLLFPDASRFVPPDRQIPSLYSGVGEKLAQGMDITSATVEGEAMANQMVDADEDFNTRYGAWHGWVEALRKIKPIDRSPAPIDASAMVAAAGLETTAEVVDHFAFRLLTVPLTEAARDSLIAFLDAELGTSRIADAKSYLEEPVRMLVHLLMSTPEYQLS